ncbi:MAG: FAD-dependent oxidoreductase [Myxococcota bacterium]
MPSVHVVVVGAGPAGASLAYLLARCGIETTLLERRSDFAREFRGEALMPSGLDAIRQMGLGPQLDALPQSEAAEVRIYQGAERRLTVPVARSGVGPHFISQPALLEMLVGEASKFPTFRLERGFTARDLLWRDDRVVGVRGDGADGPTSLEATLVVGADGRASMVRKRSPLDRRHDLEAFDVVWFRVSKPNGFGDAVRMYLGAGHFCVVFTAHDGRLQVGWVIAKGEFGELKAQGVEDWLDALRGHVSQDLAVQLDACRDSLVHPFLLDVECHHLVEWSSPGVLLFGDAAHPMSPVAGQGINIALRDALVAANHLVPVLRRGGTPLEVAAACRSIRDERLPEVKTIQAMQRLMPRVLFQRTPWSRFLVGRVAPLLAGVGLLPLMARQAAGRFTQGTTQVELRV